MILIAGTAEGMATGISKGVVTGMAAGILFLSEQDILLNIPPNLLLAGILQVAGIYGQCDDHPVATHSAADLRRFRQLPIVHRNAAHIRPPIHAQSTNVRRSCAVKLQKACRCRQSVAD